MKEVQGLFVALSDETRFRITEVLFEGERCVCEIFPRVDRTQSTVSSQLKKLIEAGILGTRKEGKKVFYRIVDYRVCEVFRVLNYANKRVCEGSCCR